MPECYESCLPEVRIAKTLISSHFSFFPYFLSFTSTLTLNFIFTFISTSDHRLLHCQPFLNKLYESHASWVTY